MKQSSNPLTRRCLVVIIVTATLLPIVWMLILPRQLQHRCFRTSRDLPKCIQSLANQLAEVDSTTTIDGFLIAGSPKPNGVSEAVFRVENCISGSFELIQEKSKLVSIAESHSLTKWIAYVKVNADFEWGPDTQSDEVDYFASSHYLDGGEGDLYVATYEPTQNGCFIIYYFNF